MSRLFFVLMLSLTLACTSGCETFKGFGRDMQKAGDWIEDTASK